MVTLNPKLIKKVFSVRNIAILLMLSQVFVKFAIEFPKIAELVNPELPLYETAWIMTAGWLLLIPLCVLKHKASFIIAAVWGVVHLCLGILPPIVGACTHWTEGTLVSIQGGLIALFSFLTYLKMKKTDKIE